MQKIGFPVLMACVGIACALPAGAVQCYATIGTSSNTFNLGNIDPLNYNPSATQITQTLNTSCSRFGADWDVGRWGTVCLSLDNGTGGASISYRTLKSGANPLQFQIYTNSPPSIAWSSPSAFINAVYYNYGIDTYQFAGYNANYATWTAAPSVNVTSLITESAASWAALIPGTYSTTLNGQVYARADGGANAIGGACPTGNLRGISFTVTINTTVIKSCKVTAGNDLVLGAAAGVLATSTNITGNTTFSVACSNTTPYYIGLSPSNGNTLGAGVMSGVTPGNTDQVPYQLRSTSGINGTIWGNTATSTSVGNGVAAVGTGSAATYTVYATAPTADYTPDSYKDTVTINVNY